MKKIWDFTQTRKFEQKPAQKIILDQVGVISFYPIKCCCRRSVCFKPTRPKPEIRWLPKIPKTSNRRDYSQFGLENRLTINRPRLLFRLKINL